MVARPRPCLEVVICARRRVLLGIRCYVMLCLLCYPYAYKLYHNRVSISSVAEPHTHSVRVIHYGSRPHFNRLWLGSSQTIASCVLAMRAPKSLCRKETKCYYSKLNNRGPSGFVVHQNNRINCKNKQEQQTIKQKRQAKRPTGSSHTKYQYHGRINAAATAQLSAIASGYMGRRTRRRMFR